MFDEAIITTDGVAFIKSPAAIWNRKCPKLTIKLTRSVVDALCYEPLPNLRDLSLAFPVTREFGQFFDDQLSASRMPIENVLQQLKHLEVQIRD
jgi:hypothetical protein